MSGSTLRVVMTGTFALVALIGAISIQVFANTPVPDWLVALIGAATGYMFGHAQANGFGSKPKNGGM